MQSNIKHRTVGSPVVRSACEPCHERKIRCIISTDGGSCDSCQSRRLSCFFLPRARSGRRPTANHTPTATASSPSPNDSSSGSRLSQPQTPNSQLPNDHFDWNWTLPAKDFDDNPHPIGLLDLDRSLSNPPTTNSFTLHKSIVTRDFSDPTKLTHQTSHLADAHTFLATDMSTLGKPTISTPPCEHENKMGTKLGEMEFSTFLQLCIQLQKHVVSGAETAFDSAARESSATTSCLQEMLGDIDRSCNAIFGVYGQGAMSRPTPQLIEDLDYASVSLVTALLLKIFQVCDAVLSCKELKNRGLMDLFLQKRLDFNLMQARIVMSKIDELTEGGFAVSRTVAMVASCVESEFKAVR